ncbi:MAG: ROK family protein [Chloroflexi bacterium]|nr:ROK family protein [Chloroflexota bacterium]MBU1749216.1 ROK family protein [Chloroflexota bacterium]MBU1879995.1 ROK family protein [Chloroflexota bacterium]
MAKKRKKRSYVVGVDLGGTKVLAAVVDDKGNVVSEAKRRTKGRLGPDAVIERVARTVQDAVDEAGVPIKRVLAVGMVAPGPLDTEAGVVHFTPNLPGWQDVPVARSLSDALKMPVFLENDVNAGTLGEYVYGVGRGVRDMVGIFVGTGVGGGIIADGKLRQGFRGNAGEVGHMIVLADGPICGCGKRGCVEALASRTAMDRDIRAALAAGRPSIMAGLIRDDAPITSGMLAQAVQAEDEVVLEVLARAQTYLGLLTASVVNLVDPELVVFGGGVVEALGEPFLKPIRATAREYFVNQSSADAVRIVLAELGDYAGVLGAATVARERLGRM